MTKPPEHADAWLAPIDPAQPSGDDCRYDPRHEAVRAEVGKLETPDKTAPDWDAVRKNGDMLLRRATKDLVIATHFAHALWISGRVQDVTLGMRVVTGLCEQFWDGLYPQRKRARSAAMALFYERLEGQLSTLLEAPAEGTELRALIEAAEALLAQVRQRLTQDAPSSRAMRGTLERLALKASELEAASEAASAPDDHDDDSPSPPAAEAARKATPIAETLAADAPIPAPAAPAAAVPQRIAPIEPPPVAPVRAAEAGPYLRETSQQMEHVARRLLEADHSDPGAYHLARVAAWLPIVKPPAIEDGRTRVPPPDDRVVERLLSLESSERWQDLAMAAEGQLRASPLWLDLQRLSERALRELGQTHAAAARTVAADTGALLERFPALLESRFADGFPFASPATRAWATSQTISTSRGTTSQPATGVEDDVALPDDLAQKLVENTQHGLIEAQERIDRHPAERDRFLLRLELATRCQETGLGDIAEALLDELARTVERHDLISWEPALARTVLARYARSLRSGAVVSGDEIRSLRAQLARVAPEALAHLRAHPSPKGPLDAR